MNRYLEATIRKDLQKRMVLLTGPRQVGKTTLSRNLERNLKKIPILDHDESKDRTRALAQGWPQRAELLILVQLQKMPYWASWFTTPGMSQQRLMTGSAGIETFQQAGESLEGRYFLWRLHPISVREWCEQTNATPEQALTHLLERGGFPEPMLAVSNGDAQRWRHEHFTHLMREDVLEVSRLHEVNAMERFAQTLQERVGLPLSIAAIAHELGVAPSTLTRYLAILESLFIVFTIRPWSYHVARATSHQPKVYFFDTGLVKGAAAARFENLVACHLLKAVHWQQDAQAKNVDLHYIRTKDAAQVDFVLSDASGEEPKLTHLIECKLSDAKPHTALKRFATEQPQALAIQLVRDLPSEQKVGAVHICHAAKWLAQLDT